MIGKWALLDIETSGVDPAQDKVIDLGFVLFDEGKYLKEASFRLKLDGTLEPLIIALTGISVPELEQQGKTWNQLKSELVILQGAVIIAHNASFEESFLKSLFDELEIHPKVTSKGDYFHDSLDIFPFLMPYFPRLGLESINQIFQLWGKEQHQGLPDSKDLADALLYAQSQTPLEVREHLSRLKYLEPWWREWVNYNFDQSLIPQVKKVKFIAPSEINEWKQDHLVAYAESFKNIEHKWLCLKLIQMLGRDISGVVSLVQSSQFDLNIVFDVARNYLKNFKNKKIVLCSQYFSPDEQLWFDQEISAISIESLSSEIFSQLSLEISTILNHEAQLWSQELMQFYHGKKSLYGVASRVPDLWCRREPVVDVLWKSCRFLARKKLKGQLAKNQISKIIVLQPSDLDILNGQENIVTLFWNARQLEWSNEFHVQKVKFQDYEHVLIVCEILEKLDAENLPTINDAKKIFESFNSVIDEFMINQQSHDSKKIYWDMDFSDLSRKYLSSWKVQVQNFLNRRENLKKYQSVLVDALWSQLDELMIQLQLASTIQSFGISWRANSERKAWELWSWNETKISYNGAKLFLDYEFDEESKEYWNEIFHLHKIEKSKRFDKIQINQDMLQQKIIEVKIWEELQPLRLVEQVKELTKRGRVLFCSQDLALSSTIYSFLVKEQFQTMATWSEVMRGDIDPIPQVVFCWEKDFRTSAVAKNLWVNFDFVIIDRIPDLAWFAWAQAAWKERAQIFSGSSFEAYWCRRAGLLKEKYWPLIRLCNAKEVYIFDSRKNKWKGDSWKILKNFIIER